MKIYDFCVEYQEKPEGLAVRQPRFSWKIEADKNNTVQQAYHLRVTAGEKMLWDSGRQEEDTSVLVPYAGEPLAEETEYDVFLTVEDCFGNRALGQTRFVTGIFEGAHFQAEMITHDFSDTETACPVFYRQFTAKKTVARACLYATAQGVYEISLNQKRVGDVYMAPGWTNYDKYLQVQYYDVTDAMQTENLIEMTVGNGWFKGILSFDCKPNRYGSRAAAFAELHIWYTDGSRECIATDGSWHVRTGQIRYSEIYMGETVDTSAPEIMEGSVSVKAFDRTILTPQASEPVRVTQRLAPKQIFTDPAGNKIVDFGQNLTGLVELSIKGENGQRVVIRHAELLDKDGVFYPDTLRTAISEDTYILNGEAQMLRPHFTFHGFRYIAVEGIDVPAPEMFTACVMHSDMKKTGDFHCSNPLVNQLQSNISWSMRDNFFDIPTDCPQRDERLGWMGDAQVFSWTAAFNRNTARFFTKWMRDVAAASSLEKGVPHIVPDIQGTYSSAAWSDAVVIIPWVVYQTCGDVRILEENWQCMHEWIDYIKNHTNENGLWMSGYQYGDWLALDREAGESSVGATDVFFVANAYYLYVTDLVRQIADVLGKAAESAYYGALYRETLESFRKEYFTQRGRIVSETQTACVLALHWHLAEEKDRQTVLKALLTNIENHKNHLTTGFVGTPYLCHALSDNGAHEMASTLFMREDMPSWLYAVHMGATTIWERWDGIRPDKTMPHPGLNSMNHYAYGSIGDWMYRKIGGINQLEPGYHRFYVKPMFVKGIEEAHAELETPYGKIVSEWCCRDKTISVRVIVPANTTAVIWLPEKDQPQEVGSGEYFYTYATDTCLSVQRFTMDNTLGDIMEQPAGRQLLEQMAPELINNPMIEYAKRMTLAEGISFAPEIRAVYEAVLEALNT